jgi:hypothetical protein
MIAIVLQRQYHKKKKMLLTAHIHFEKKTKNKNHLKTIKNRVLYPLILIAFP